MLAKELDVELSHPAICWVLCHLRNVNRPASVKGISQYASKSASLTSGLLVVMTVCSCEYSGFTLTFFAFVFFLFLKL